ncbi:hypothetical protein [Streptomyces sp. NPDC017993]|uniref:hypothetical protein n=1 Tax=Streptomyces sp. NPDC017993 TaxID=3365027 RepID=UPI003795EE5F
MSMADKLKKMLAGDSRHDSHPAEPAAREESSAAEPSPKRTGTSGWERRRRLKEEFDRMHRPDPPPR